MYALYFASARWMNGVHLSIDRLVRIVLYRSFKLKESRGGFNVSIAYGTTHFQGFQLYI